MGITFKENCPDIRNTKVVDIYHTLKEYTDDITIWDPWVNSDKTLREYNIQIEKELESDSKYDAVILAVAHREFFNIDLKKHLNPNGVIYDVKGILDRNIIDGRL